MLAKEVFFASFEHHNRRINLWLRPKIAFFDQKSNFWISVCLYGNGQNTLFLFFFDKSRALVRNGQSTALVILATEKIADVGTNEGQTALEHESFKLFV